MKRYAETFFRHWLLFTLPLLLAVLGAGSYISHAKRQFSSTATIWCDAPLPGSSTVDQSSTGPTPAAVEEGVLQELLQTHSFPLAVGRHSPMAAYLMTLPPQRLDSSLSAIAKEVTLSTPGAQVLNVTVKAATPDLASGLAGAVVDQFTSTVVDTLRARGAQMVSYGKQQMALATTALDDARSQLASYLAAHSPQTVASSNDVVGALTAAVASAQQEYNTAQQSYLQATVDLSHVSDAAVVRVEDRPSVPTPLSRKKAILFGGLGSILAGAVISLLLLAAVVAGDRSARQPDDIEGPLGLRVVGSIGHLPRRHRLGAKAATGTAIRA